MEKTYRQMIDDFVEDQVVDVEELESYNPKCEDWEETEELRAKCKQAIRKINEDGLWEWTNIPDYYKDQAIQYIKEKRG